MPSLRDVSINQRISFEVYPTSVIGNNYRDVRLEGILSARSAASSGVDIAALHMAVYPSLPQGTPNDPFAYGYIEIQHPNGAFEVLGIPWVREDTLQISTGGRLTLIFENKTQQDLERISSALSANGYAPDEVKVTQ